MVEDIVNGCVQPTIQFVNDLMDNEKIFVNTARHDFRGAAVLAEKKLKEEIPSKKTKEQLQKEQAQQLINLCSRYFELIRTQITDIVPKAVVMMLVEGSSNQIKDHLLRKILSSGVANDMMKEDPRISANRKKCKELLIALNQANEILNQATKFRI